MFCFFKNEYLVNFWSNKVGDCFLEITCNSMKWQKTEIDLLFFDGIDSVPQFYEFDANKNLILKNEVKTIVETSSVNELGETIITQNEVVTYEAYKTIEPIVYFAKGLMIRPC